MIEEEKSEYTQFWIETVVEKGPPRINIINGEFIKFLEQKGCRKLLVRKDYELVKIISNSIVSSVETHSVREEVKNYLKKIKRTDVWEVFLYNDFLSKRYIESLESVSINFNAGNEKTGVLFYNNGVIKIEAEKMEIIPYCDYHHYVWESQISQRNFEKHDSECEFKKFCLNISGRKSDRFEAFQTLIGYLLHTYKDPSITKAVILMDEDIDTERSQSNGGTGKSLVATALKNIIPTLVKNGKSVKTDDKFFFADVEPQHRIIVFDDVKETFSFENLYAMITGDLPIEKKYKNPISMDFKSVPKVLITTNYVVTGTGGNSEERRKVVFEVNSYYRTETTIIKEFGHRFFDDWDDEEWLKFDNFMVECLQLYLAKGLIEAPEINVKSNKLIQDTCFEFVEFMDDVVNKPTSIPGASFNGLHVRFDKATLIELFLKRNKEYSKKLSGITFKWWIDSYCESKNIEFQHKKSNGFAYVYLYNILKEEDIER